jgi:enediyne biosynthesis protein E4
MIRQLAIAAVLLAQASTPPRVIFTDVTASAGIHFQHTSGAFGRKYLPETMGSGAAFFDADGDGLQDIFLVNSTHWPGRPAAPSSSAFYRNRGDGTFVDQTRAAGLQMDLYGMGASSADYDNDGRADLYVTALGRNRLFHNEGRGHFVDVTDRAGVADPGFSTSAAWLDYDRDGFVDLFVAHYVEWSIDKDLYCTLDGTQKSYCTPESYHGQSATLFRNTGHGTFQNVSRAASVYDPNAKALGVALLDYDNDGWLDLFVANDRQPNRLYRNMRNGKFVDVGLTAGVSFDETGTARAGMGVDAADYDGSGRQSLAIGNFSNEMMSLYTSQPRGLFIDRAPATAIGRSSVLKLTFGLFFFDYDLDGRPDLFAANGHVADDIGRVQKNVSYAQPPDLYWNAGMGRFEDVGRAAGDDFRRPIVARGAAYADYDADGDLDVLVTTNNGPARLLRNDGGNRNNWLRVIAIGGPSNRDGIGSKVQLLIDGNPGPWSIVKTGSSYCSQSELPLTFGIGRATRVSGLKITWPDGSVDNVAAIDANQTVTIQERRGIIRSTRPPR